MYFSSSCKASSVPTAPNASAHSCLTIPCSSFLPNTSANALTDSFILICPKTNAISCLNKAESSENPFARILTASTLCKSLKENIALYLLYKHSFLSKYILSSSSIFIFSNGYAGSKESNSDLFL
ncbi:hypothetical protein GVAV_000441 [Gurleya vavrai]